MKYNLNQIKLTNEEENILRIGLERDIEKRNKTASPFFLKAKEAYKHFDFSQLSHLDKLEVHKIREKYYDDPELSTRPLLFIMYIFHRNGFLKNNYLNNPDNVFDIIDKDFLSRKRLNVPEGIITENGKLYGIGKDGHIWLYYFLNLSGIDTTDCVRYGKFEQTISSKNNSKFTKTERTQYFSKLKELSSQNENFLYLSDEQAIAIDNLRRYYNPETPLQTFLLSQTADLGFRADDNPRTFNCNFDVFAKNCLNSYLDKTEMNTSIRVERERAKDDK